jgi:hypothetical protein
MIIVAEDAPNKKVITAGPAREVRVGANRVLTAPLTIGGESNAPATEASNNGRRADAPGDAAALRRRRSSDRDVATPRDVLRPSIGGCDAEFKTFLRAVVWARDGQNRMVGLQRRQESSGLYDPNFTGAPS